jgi:carbamoyltransferase
MRVLGISAFYHDSAVAIATDGRVVAAVQEERLSRLKHDAAFPARAIVAALETADLGWSDIDHVVYYEKPLVKFERLLESWLAHAPGGFRAFAAAAPLWLRERLFLRESLGRSLRRLGWDGPLHFTAHHHAHAASAFFPSPFDEALVLCLDGVGEWETATVGVGRGATLTLDRSLHYPHSLGLLYAAFTAYCGFRVNSGEYKLMGLAPYGTPVYADLIREHLVHVADDGSFHLDLRYFAFSSGLTMTNRHFEALFGGPPHPADAAPTQRTMDLAASVQAVTEHIVCAIVRDAVARTGLRRLCLAGGVALNCVANGRLLREGIVDELFVQPASGDAGAAVGAALVVGLAHGAPRVPELRADLGPSWSDDAVRATLDGLGLAYRELPLDALLAETAAALAAGEVVGWFQGAMEFGPRALGFRSILADPRGAGVRDRVNARVKRRESFRPFAPACLADHADDWFETFGPDPFMTRTVQVREERRDALPAVTHVDGSARLQTVEAAANPRFHALLQHFHEATGCPILLNTSFNVRGEPIVCTPEDAVRCYRGTDIDRLVVGRCALTPG